MISEIHKQRQAGETKAPEIAARLWWDGMGAIEQGEFFDWLISRQNKSSQFLKGLKWQWGTRDLSIKQVMCLKRLFEETEQN